MFDIGFSELLLFGAIALVILGPEKLPQAARSAGRYYAKIRRTISNIQHEIEAELDLAETRKQMQAELAKIKQAEADMKREMEALRSSFQELQQHGNVPAMDEVDNLKPAATDPTDLTPPTDASATSHQGITAMTEPMYNQWFLLGQWERDRRWPAAPLMPNYQADALLYHLPAKPLVTAAAQPTGTSHGV